VDRRVDGKKQSEDGDDGDGYDDDDMRMMIVVGR
jgi:hypothetical protein